MDTPISPTGVVRKYAEELPMNFLECRGEEHDWRKLNAYTILDKSDPLYGARFRSRRCFVCKGVKKRWTDPSTGEVLKVSRVMPEGYERKGQGRIDRSGKNVLRQVYDRRDQVGSIPAPKPRARSKPASRTQGTVSPMFQEPAA